MGLDISHDTWHGAYSAFHRWRKTIAQYAGIPLDLMQGFYQPDDLLGDPFASLQYAAGSLNTSDKERFNARLNDLKIGFPLKWEDLKPKAIHELLYHSDCEGHITWRKAKKIADELTEIMKLIPEDLDCGGHIGNVRAKTQQFIEGCQAAYVAKENLIFG